MRGISEVYEMNMRRTREEYVMFIINDLTSETSNSYI